MRAYLETLSTFPELDGMSKLAAMRAKRANNPVRARPYGFRYLMRPAARLLVHPHEGVALSQKARYGT